MMMRNNPSVLPTAIHTGYVVGNDLCVVPPYHSTDDFDCHPERSRRILKIPSEYHCKLSHGMVTDHSLLDICCLIKYNKSINWV